MPPVSTTKKGVFSKAEGVAGAGRCGPDQPRAPHIAGWLQKRPGCGHGTYYQHSSSICWGAIAFAHH